MKKRHCKMSRTLDVTLLWNSCSIPTVFPNILYLTTSWTLVNISSYHSLSSTLYLLWAVFIFPPFQHTAFILFLSSPFVFPPRLFFYGQFIWPRMPPASHDSVSEIVLTFPSPRCPFEPFIYKQRKINVKFIEIGRDCDCMGREKRMRGYARAS